MAIPIELLATIITYENESFDTDYNEILSALKDDHKDTGFHFIDGAFTGPDKKIIPRTLAGFAHINDHIADKRDVFAVVVQADVESWETKTMRKNKVVTPLLEEFPNRDFVVIFINEPTPEKLFNQLAEGGIDMVSLHKWIRGTNPVSTSFKGGHNFKHVFAHPIPDMPPPSAGDIGEPADYVQLVDLCKGEKPYLTKDAKYISKSELVNFLQRNSGPAGMTP